MVETVAGEDPVVPAPARSPSLPAKNLDPLKPLLPAYHFVGIGGVGMSALAYILAKQGFRVSGSDIAANGRTRRLEALGVRFIQGHTLEGLAGDPQVVYSSAIRPSNPELAAALDKGLKVWHRADLLAALFNHRPSIGVAGTHGKTTTSSMIGYVLLAAGWDPTLIIGGEMDAWDGNARLGQGEYLVAEVDESDGSLVRLYPKIGVITNIELDHPDHYANLEQVIRAFQQYGQQSQTLVACLDCPNVATHLAVDIGYSLAGHPQAQYQAREIVYAADFTSAEIWERGSLLGQLRLQVLGSHNLSNALAAVAVGRQLGLEFPVIASALAQFRGVQRRFEAKGEVGGVTFIDDYAHHPSEVRATLRAAYLQQRRVVAVFQPHRHSRLAALFQDFARCFENADVVVIVPTYGAGEPAPERSDSLRLAVAVAEHHPQVRYVSSLRELPQVLASVLQPGDLAIFLGAGDLNQQIAATMRAYAAQVGEQALADLEEKLPGQAENGIGEMGASEVLAS
ncbi:UDP-N-acetylmuramate--L-alanine ligase [Synechococcus sp. B60.1]|uniref:UDP-N-acetylmuramate--L-alanine ligase n=1 Tax=Synechococcus sp. B60.1 TaxID=2964522 RepID=UPI0039C4BE26